ncbi:hypothetical protein GGQ85_002940 [Nitrobacter vulgaris]|uniref:Chitin-binding type-4 domain-containing protein n=1 Tax=Nitrobacter vulgaris TaxID=29421 RepID=A0A1V4HWS3_NITVU|nr:hypothetical protein [Nitrobacter vulgaris]MDR6305221.1 hypothetical protein [Nitrobacter vulgaris]OPH82020.1 hypothetical protein B2M20_14810 [Nitrobacter vulgaris]
MTDRRTVRNSCLAILPTLLLVLSLSGAYAQTIVSFDGDRGPGIETCKPKIGPIHCDRAEMDVAASGKQVVQVTWQNVNVYDPAGNLLKSTPLSAVIRAAGLDPNPPRGGGPFEPHIIYDEFIERWVITVTCRNDCTLVSAGPDATGAWGGTSLSCLQGGACLDRDPGLKLGYDKNGIYVCGGHIGDDNLATVPGVSYDCFAVPSNEVKAIAQGIAPTHINRGHNMPLDIVPAIDHDPTKAAAAPAFFANKSCDRTAQYACQRSPNFSFDWIVNTFTWNGGGGTYNSGGSQQVIKTDVGSKSNKWLYNTPCCADIMSIPQAGSEVTLRAAPSHRLMNVVQHGWHLYGVLGTGPCREACGSQGADPNNILIYVDLDCSQPAACVVSQTAKLASTDLHLEFGTIGVDGEGNIGIVGTASSARTNLSVLLWTHRKDDPAGRFADPATVVAGTQPYTCRNEKSMAPMGNSVGILTALDPVDRKTLWATQQWANDISPCVWATRIVGYKIMPEKQ